MEKYQLNHCRFCGKSEIGTWGHSDKLVKYGTRHYAHHACYLDAGKDIFRLSRWQVEQFPYRILKSRGLIEKIERTKRVGDLIGNW